MKENDTTKKLSVFYIALCCCVIAIGAAGFIMQGNETEPANTSVLVSETDAPDEETAVYDIQNADVVDDKSQIAAIDTPAIEPETTADVDDYAYDNPDVAASSIVVNAAESEEFANPLSEMTVKFGFVTDKLIYNEVYGDWRTHNGIDLAAPIGCSVNAVADGTVKTTDNTSYGNTVTIEHNNGFVSVYSQLGDINVKPGDSIKQGSVIGTVGKSTGENLKDSHLHFELHKDGKPVNPEEY